MNFVLVNAMLHVEAPIIGVCFVSGTFLRRLARQLQGMQSGWEGIGYLRVEGYIVLWSMCFL